MGPPWPSGRSGIAAESQWRILSRSCRYLSLAAAGGGDKQKGGRVSTERSENLFAGLIEIAALHWMDVKAAANNPQHVNRRLTGANYGKRPAKPPDGHSMVRLHQMILMPMSGNGRVSDQSIRLLSPSEHSIRTPYSRTPSFILSSAAVDPG